MALSKQSVAIVRNFFATNYEQCTIHAKDENQHGADEVYIIHDRMVSTGDLQRIVDCSNKIGNTVSVGSVEGHKGTCICFW